jgi:hypothetical protein
MSGEGEGAGEGSGEGDGAGEGSAAAGDACCSRLLSALAGAGACPAGGGGGARSAWYNWCRAAAEVPLAELSCRRCRPVLPPQPVVSATQTTGLAIDTVEFPMLGITELMVTVCKPASKKTS